MEKQTEKLGGFVCELFRVNTRPDSGNAGLAIGESRPLFSGDSPNNDQDSENDEMGSFRE